METMNAWKECTQKIFWGVIVIAVAGLFNTVYDYVSLATNFMGQLSSFLPGGMDRGMSSFLTAVSGIGIAVKGAIVVGYVLYLLGLKQFAGIQSNALAAQNILKVRTAVIILICCFAASAVFGILLNIPVLSIPLTLAIWVATLVAYFKMKNAFGVLSMSPAFSAKSQSGAKKLRTAALCNIWVMLLPIIAVVFVGILILSVFSGMSSNGQSLQSTMMTGGIILALMGLCAIVLLIIALIFPFIGWYKIMMGGPGADFVSNNVLTSGVQEQIPVQQAPIQQAPIQQAPVQQTPVQTFEQQIPEPQSSEKVQMPYDNLLQSLGKSWQSVKPKIELVKEWTVANKSKVGIGVGVAALAALLIWLVPKIFDGGPVEFETYEQLRDTVCANGASAEIWVSFDVPQGSGSKQKNVEKAMRELISLSKLAREIGAPIDGSLREVADDYVKRFLECAANGDDYGATRCDLGIASGYQNESIITLHFSDGLYGNGGPQETDCVVRLSDGHIMQQQEMVQISDNRLEAIMNRYVTNDFVVNLSEGYHLSPVGLDSCKIIWPIGSHLNGEVIIPISELEPFMTKEGKAIFKAKPVGAAAQKPKQDEEVAETGEEKSNTDSSYGRGDLGIFDLRGPVKRCVQNQRTLTFDANGRWLAQDGESVADKYSGGIKRDENGHLIKGMFDAYDETGHDYRYNAQGLVVEINYRDWMDAGSNVTYVYDENGHVKKETHQEWGLDADEEAKVFEYTILELDKYNNWIRRKDQNGLVETRQISYYETEQEASVAVPEPAPEPQPKAASAPETATDQRVEAKSPEKKAKKPGDQKTPSTNPQPAPEPAVAPAPPKPGEKTVNLNQLINYTNQKK